MTDEELEDLRAWVGATIRGGLHPSRSKQVLDALDHLTAENRALRDALRPFALVAARKDVLGFGVGTPMPDAVPLIRRDADFHGYDGSDAGNTPTVGHCRRAAELLGEDAP